MFQRVVTASLRRPFVVLLAGVAIVAGFLQFGRTEVSALPEFTPTVVEVQTEALGLSALEVEQLITVPLEADLLNGVAFVQDIHSYSLPSLSSILLTFEPGTDVFRARQMVQERLTQAHGLPNVSRAPAMVQPLSSESRVMMLGLSSDQMSLPDMSILTRWTVRPRLMGVPGVANVTVWGHRERQLQVQVDPARLREHGLTLQDIVSTTGNSLWVSPLSYLEASTPGTGGFIDTPNQRLGIQHIPAISNAEDLAAVPIEGHEDLRLGDVATVVQDHQPLIGDAILERGPGLLVVIEKFPWANAIDVTRGVDQALAELAPGMAGIAIDRDLYRPANYLERSLDNVRLAAIAGAVLLVVVVLALSYSWRIALISLSSLVVSLFAALVVLDVVGATLNAMVIAGLVAALGLLIDHTLGDLEVVRGRLEGPSGDGTPDSLAGDIGAALAQSRSPVLYGAAALVIGAVPLFFLEGSARAFLPPAALAYILALAISVLAALTLTPALAVLLLPGSAHRESPVLASLRGSFPRVLEGALRGPAPALVAVIGLALIGALAISRLDRTLVPTFQQTDLLVRFEGEPGMSLPEARRILGESAAKLRALPGVRDAGAQIGRAVLSDELVNVNSGELWISVDPEAPYDRTVAAVAEVLRGTPGIVSPVPVSYLNERIGEELAQPSSDLLVRVYGQDPETLARLAAEVASMVDGVPGTVDVRAIPPLQEPVIAVEVDLDRAAAYQLKPGDVRRAAATLLSGIEVGSLFEEQKVFEVVVWGAPGTRDSIASVRDLLIDTPSGDLVRLGDVAEVGLATSAGRIERDSVSRYIDVVGNVRGRGVDAVEDEIEAGLGGLGMPFEYYVRQITEHGTQAADPQVALGIALAAGVVVFLLFHAAFESWRVAVLVFVTAPLALVGGLAASALFGGALTLGAWLGAAGVLGLAGRHGLALVARLEELQRRDLEKLDAGLVQRVVAERLVPTLMSVLTLAAALLPIVVLGSRAGFEVIRPAAIFLLGGLVTSTAVTLLLVPALYLRFATPASAREPLLDLAWEKAA